MRLMMQALLPSINASVLRERLDAGQMMAESLMANVTESHHPPADVSAQASLIMIPTACSSEEDYACTMQSMSFLTHLSHSIDDQFDRDSRRAVIAVDTLKKHGMLEHAFSFSESREVFCLIHQHLDAIFGDPVVDRLIMHIAAAVPKHNLELAFQGLNSVSLGGLFLRPNLRDVESDRLLSLYRAETQSRAILSAQHVGLEVEASTVLRNLGNEIWALTHKSLHYFSEAAAPQPVDFLSSFLHALLYGPALLLHDYSAELADGEVEDIAFTADTFAQLRLVRTLIDRIESCNSSMSFGRRLQRMAVYSSLRRDMVRDLRNRRVPHQDRRKILSEIRSLLTL